MRDDDENGFSELACDSFYRWLWIALGLFGSIALLVSAWKP